MKPKKIPLSKQPLVAVKQIALSFESDKLTMKALSKAILCHAQTRILLAVELKTRERALAEAPNFKILINAQQAKHYEWPDELFEDNSFSFLDLNFDDDEQNEKRIDDLFDLVKKIVATDKKQKWFKPLDLDTPERIIEFYKLAQNKLENNINPEKTNLVKLLKLFERHSFRKLHGSNHPTLPLFVLTHNGQDELALLSEMAEVLTQNPIIIFDEPSLEEEDSLKDLDEKPNSIILVRLSSLHYINGQFDKLINYLEFRAQNNYPEDFSYHDLDGNKKHLLDSHFIVLQLSCPSDFDLSKYTPYELIFQLNDYIKQQRSVNIEVFADMTRLNRLLRFARAENIFIYQQPEAAEQLRYASLRFLTRAELILNKNFLKHLSDDFIHQAATLTILSSVGQPFSETDLRLSEICYEWFKILPSEINSFNGFYLTGFHETINEALLKRESAVSLIKKLQTDGSRLGLLFQYDPIRHQIQIKPNGYSKIKNDDNTQYLLSTNQFRFDHVIGMDEAKQRLQMIIDYFKTPSKFDHLKAKPPLRLVLTGPPGCGKTMLAKAFSSEIGIPFYSISASEITSQKYAGWGASLLRNVFESAQKTTPCVIFLDELDAFGSRAAYSSDSVGFDARSIMNTLLVLLDGINTDERIIVLAATNRIEDLDAALLRPKRFGTILHIEPLSLNQKATLIRNLLPESICSDNYEQIIEYLLARASGDVSPAKIEDIVSEVKLKALSKNLDGITYQILVETVDDILLGKKRQRVSEEHKISKAYHEAAFAVLHKAFFYDIPIERISVQYRSESFGGTFLNDQAENQTAFYTDEELIALMITHLSAPLAEKKQLGKYSVSSSAGFAIAAKLSLLLAGNLDLEKGLEHSVQYALFELDNADEQFQIELNRLSVRIIETAAAYATELLEKFWPTISKLAEELVRIENLDKGTIDQLINNIQRYTVPYDDFINRFKSGNGPIGFKKLPKELN